MPDRGKGYLNLRSGKIKRGHHGNSRASQAYQKPPAKKKERDNHGGSEHSPILQEPQTRDKESPDEAGSDDNQYYRMEEGSNHDSHDHCYEIIEKRRYGGYAKQADNHVYDYELDDEHDCVWKNRFLEKECGSDDLQSVTIVLKFTEGEDAVIEVDLRRVEE
ncbi:hypothetical protein B0O99DRAFT_622223 [Bisporella sp. PMI_857]|nr:hypothetical protein B0O99DRAFT_622223 [Bisporella sp. PMI_857]